MTKNIEPIYIDRKARGNQLTAEEFNKIPEKVNELVKAQNAEEERTKGIIAKNRPSLGQISNVSVEVDSLTSETCVLVWNSEEWVPMKLSELPIGQGGGGQQQTILYYLRAVNQSPSTTLSASKSAGECAIKFMFVSRTKDVGQTEYVDTGEWGTYEIFAKAGDGTFVSKARGRCQSNTITTVDVFKFLESGQNNIMVKITGEVTGQTSPALVYSITLSALFLSISEFNWWKAYQGDIVLPCYISGNISKTLHVKVTGEGYEQTYERQFGTATYTSSPVAYTIPFTNKTGIFHLSAWLSNDDNTVQTQPVGYDFMAVANNEAVKMVVVNNKAGKLLNWYENNVLEYAVYDGKAVTTPLVICMKKDGEVLQENVSESTLTQTKMQYTLSLEVETLDNSDFTARIGFRSHSADTEMLRTPIDFPVDNSQGYSATSGAVFYFNAKNRNNTDTDRNVIRNLITTEHIPVEWQNVAFSRDGWVMDEVGARTLRLTAGARLTIDYKPFGKEAAQSGKTIEIDYQVNNTSDYDADCITIAIPYQKQYIGLKIKAASVMFATRSEHNADVQAMNMDDGVRIRLALVISPKKYTYVLNGNTYYLNLAYLYIDGVEARKFAYLLTDSMLTGDSGKIVVGSDKADVDLYSVRIYDSAMDAANVHQDYINALSTVGEKSAEKLDNDIYDALGTTVDFDKLRGKINIFTFDKPLPAYEYGKSYKPKGTLETYPKDGNTNLNRLTITNLQLQGQGTSSMLYYLWNWKAKVGKDTTIVYEDGQTAQKKFELFKSLPKVSKITAKKNIASSMQFHKLGSVNSFTDLWKAVGLTNEGVQQNGEARVSIYQETFVGFEKQTADDGTVSYKFVGLFTLGPDKGDAATFGYDKDLFPDLLSIEGSDNSPRLTLFQVPWDKRRIRYNVEEEAYQYQVSELSWENCWDLDFAVLPGDDPSTTDNETRQRAEQLIESYIPAYNIVYQCSTFIAPFEGTLDELNADPHSTYMEYWIAKAGDPNQYNLYYYDSLYKKFCPSTLDSGVSVVNLRQQLVGNKYGLTESVFNAVSDVAKLNELFKAARIQKFRAEQPAHWDISDCLYHQLYVEATAATDNCAKNTYPYNFNAE